MLTDNSHPIEASETGNDQIPDELAALRQRIAALEAGTHQPQAAEEALRESEHRFRILFEHSPDAILVFDPHHPEVLWPIMDCNAAACRLNGYTREELLGQSVQILSTGQPTREGCAAFLERLRCEGTIYSETVHRRKDGTLFSIEFSTSLITVEGRELVLGIDRDITERKQAEAERVAAEALRQTVRRTSQFLANVSHELRTPLHHIKGYAATLLQRGQRLNEPTRQDYLHVIVDASDKLTRLIDDLLNTAQLENDTFIVNIDSVRLDDLVQRTVQRWQGVETHHFTAVLPPEVPPLPADARRIEQVLDNLLANVVRHTPPGTSTTLSLQVTRDAVVVAVSDQGPGIASEDQRWLFERGYQAGATGGSRRGSGLGLFISKGIIEQHGGCIWVEVPPGGGTSFRFSLPRRRRHATV